MADPCFIVGCPRSGTTLLSVLLDRHPDLSITPETAFYDEIAPHLPVTDPEALRRLLGGWRRLAELGLEPEAVIAALPDGVAWPLDGAAVFGAVLEARRQVSGKPFVGEKTPQHLRHVPRILADFPAARVVCMMRDGRDVACSLRDMPWWGGGAVSGARLWLEAEQQCGDLEAAHPDRFMSVVYEDLVTAPGRVLSTVMVFLDLSFDPRQLSAETPSGVVLQRSLAWKGEALEPVRPVRRDRLAATPPQEVAELVRLMGPTLRRRGYAVTGSGALAAVASSRIEPSASQIGIRASVRLPQAERPVERSKATAQAGQ